MSEKDEGGAQTQVAPVEEPQETQSGSESVPEPEEMSEEAKKAYEGKTPDELAQMHYGLSKKLGEQGAVIGSLKDLVEEMRAGREKQTEAPNPFQVSYEPTQEVAPPVSQEAKLSDDDFLTVGAMKKMQGQRDEESKQQKYQELLTKTSMAFERGKTHTEKNKRLYEGIENEVATRVAQQCMIPFKAFGMDVSPILESQETWDNAAKYVRVERNEFDRLTPSKTTPMTATATETPSSVRPSPSAIPAVEINMQDRDMAEFNDAVANAYVDTKSGKRPAVKTEEIVKKGHETMTAGKSLEELSRRS